MQSASSILMVRPACFGFNSQTAVSNAFQHNPAELSEETVNQNAQAEFDAMVLALQAKGIDVVVVKDTETPIKPDAIFPNNWVSFHADGTVILYPMAVDSRRLECRPEIIEDLQSQFKIKKILDLQEQASAGKILEGTGSIVFDHPHKKAFACLSPRTERALFESLAQTLGYEAIAFQALDESGQEIYHTNVMMSIGEKFAVVCMQSIANKLEQAKVYATLQSSNLEIIDVTFSQMAQFTCNILQLHNQDGKPYLVMSKSAENAFTPAQKQVLSSYAELLPVAIPTIETVGGGSARCMLAEIFCERL